MCCRKVFHRNGLGFRDVQFLGENLRESVNKHGLSGSLFVNSSYDLGRECLTNFVGVLDKEFLYLFKRNAAKPNAASI